MARSGTGQRQWKDGVGRRLSRPAVLLGVAGALIGGGCGEEGTGEPINIAPPQSVHWTTVPPATAAPTTTSSQYVVTVGDSMIELAERFGISIAELAAANGIDDPDSIEAGQVLVIPLPTTTTVAAPPTGAP